MSAAQNSASSEQRPAETPSAPANILRNLRAEVAELRETGTESLTDSLACWLTAQYAVAARLAAEEAQARNSALPMDYLRPLCSDLVALRKGDHCAVCLAFERERFEVGRGRSRERMEAQFEEWLLKDPKSKERCQPETRLSPEERAQRIRERSGLETPAKRSGHPPEPPAEIDHAA